MGTSASNDDSNPFGIMPPAPDPNDPNWEWDYNWLNPYGNYIANLPKLMPGPLSPNAPSWYFPNSNGSAGSADAPGSWTIPIADTVSGGNAAGDDADIPVIPGSSITRNNWNGVLGTKSELPGSTENPPGFRLAGSLTSDAGSDSASVRAKDSDPAGDSGNAAFYASNMGEQTEPTHSPKSRAAASLGYILGLGLAGTLGITQPEAVLLWALATAAGMGYSFDYVDRHADKNPP